MPTPSESSPNTTPSYGHGDDWQLIEDIQMGVFTFGKDTELPSGIVREDIEDVACLLANPSENLLTTAELASVSKIDKLITIWAVTLFQGETPVVPSEGDIIAVSGQLWLIASVTTVVFETQYKCLCRRLRKV